MKFLLNEKEQIADGTYELTFKPAEGEMFQFEPGQYVEMELIEPRYRDDRGNARIFSIASAPHEKKLLVAFRQSDSAFKKSLLELEAGRAVEVRGPFGFFTVPNGQTEPVLFIAGGMGITPFLSMVRSQSKGNGAPKTALLYSNSSAERAAYHGELSAAAEANGWLDYFPNFGSLNEESVSRAAPENASLIYVAGPSGMVAKTMSILAKTGVPRGKILAEEFPGY